MDRGDSRRQARWLTTFRVVIVTGLLGAAFAIEIFSKPDSRLEPLVALAVFAYATVLLASVLERWAAESRWLPYTQLLGDAAVITGFVAVTGGLDSPMSFLYVLPIGVASFLGYRRGCMALAAVCWVSYATAVMLPGSWSFFQGVVPTAQPETGPLAYRLVVHFVAFVSVASLASHLAERVRERDVELIERSGALARLQALNENIIESINSGLVTTDLDGTIQFMNRGGGEICGHPPREALGSSIETWFRFEPGSLASIRTQLMEKLRFRFEKWHDTADGRRIFLGIAASNLYDRGGQPLGFIFIFQDLTEIEALEREVRLKERMAALGEVAAGMAHELRNPLAAISGSVQYLKGALATDPERAECTADADETLDLMDIILRESQRLDQAIKDFLVFAKPGRFHAEPTDLVRLLRDCVKLLSNSPEMRPDHRIEERYAEDRIVARVDVDRMKQVFWNLATNALKAMPNGGTLTLRVTAPAAGGVDISFRDEGEGMTESQLEKYYQPFQSSFDEGTGLGAAIVYRLVQEHGGRIRLDSEPGRGTDVRISLPPSCLPGAVEAATHTGGGTPDAREATA